MVSYSCDTMWSDFNGATPKLILNRLHQTETEWYFDKSTSGPKA